MKNLICALMLLSSFAWAEGQKTPFISCKALLIKTVTLSGKKFKYRPFWKEEFKELDLNKKRDVNALLIAELAQFFEAKKAVPTFADFDKILAKKFANREATEWTELIYEEGLEGYFQHEGTPENILQIFALATVAFPDKFEAVVSGMRKMAADFFLSHLRFPTDLEFAEKFSIDVDFIPYLIGNPHSFITDLLGERPHFESKARDRLAIAFLRYIGRRDKPEAQKTRAMSPTPATLLDMLLLGARHKPLGLDIQRGQFTVKDVERLLGGEAPLKDPGQTLGQIVLFPSGMKGVEGAARSLNPNAFKGFLPEEIYNEERTAALLNALENKAGFLATSVNAGIPIDEGQLSSMLKYAQDRDFDILVFPTSQIFDGLDPRLIDNPRIHIITHSVGNTFFKLWNIPILAKNQNALASLDKHRQILPGQQIIVGHAQLSHRNVATGTNHIRATSLWSTGSLSQNLYPHRHPVQGRTSALAENNHTNGFLVLEKADLDSGGFQEGTQNYWHIRSVNYNNDLAVGGRAGFTDVGVTYYLTLEGRIKKQKGQIKTLVLGDLHDAVSDQQWIQAFFEFLKSHPEIEQIVIHDPIDGLSHNRHEAKQLNLMIQKFKSGELDYHKEMMGLVQFVNALTSAAPNLKVVIADSNHSYWGKALLDGRTETQSVVNGIFLTELEHASRILGISDPLTYVFKARNTYIQSLPPYARRDFDGKAILVTHPERVEVLAYGRNFVVGPSYRPVHVNFHGHQGANGARPSPKSHAVGAENSITADSHQSFILGDWMSVGTSTPLRVGYNDGGYSSWINSMAIVFDDGSKQPLLYSSLSKTFMQRSGHPVPSAKEFYGDAPLEVELNSNDVVGGEVTDQFSHFLDVLGVPKPPRKVKAN